MNAQDYRTLVNKLEAIQEMQPTTSTPMSGGRPMPAPRPTGPSMNESNEIIALNKILNG